jgi:ATP phosphoribosyltransferase
MKPLNLGIPKGSLEDATIKLFRRAGWKISGSSRSYIPTIDDDDISCKLARPQEMSRYVESGALDAAITGSDWTLENESDVAVIADLVYSRISFLPTKWVLAVKNDSPVQKAEDLEGGVIATEFVKSTERYFAEKGTSVQVEFSWGATEAKAAEGLVDAIVDVTETGSTLRANGLRIVDTLTTSNPQLIANHESYEDPDMRAKIDQIALLLRGALEAESRVGLKLNIPKDRIESILELLPSITAPTVANLYGKDWFSVEIVVSEVEVRDLIPRLRERGAEGIIEYPLTKIV